jgi:endonuclease-3
MATRVKRPRSLSPTSTTALLASSSTASESPQKTKKLKLLADYAAASPFPDHVQPTPTAAREVHAVLSAAHPAHAAHRRPPQEDANAAQTCGKVPNVLESLLGTILAQNTSCKNATGARRALDAAFGRNGFAAIAAAKRADVVEALRSGGLANKKAKVIQEVLAEVKERYGEYSLQHLAKDGISDDEVMQELVRCVHLFSKCQHFRLIYN